MTETVIHFLITFALCFIGGYFLGKLRPRKLRQKADFMESFERHEDASHPDLATYTYTNKSSDKPLTTPPASETKLSKDHDLESYKDLSAGKCKRFSSDDLDEVSHMLTDDELRKFGG